MGNEKMLRVNGIELCAETFGDPVDPAILLIGGATSSMDWWAEEFCARLSGAGRLVIRYDHRDTGRSTSEEPGRPSYTGDALTEDALGLLDALGVARAHLAGLSMGGCVAQELAVRHPDRVASLTAMSTTFHAPGGPDLPPMTPELKAGFDAAPGAPDWADRAAVIDYLVADWLPYSGPAGATEAELRELAGRVVDRSVRIASSGNHWLVGSGGEPEPEHRLGEVSVPALVIHGTADPLFPFPHGEALAAAIPGARLVALHGVGHEVPPPSTWDTVVPAIVEVTARGQYSWPR
ncbi:alpha/beta fold hydrolase [Allokutzneria sp. A3M-2-11 16]|uniref:alpha/beta fold hydrolase n=1 Tax=Allokutzneria sp. A3M-2-11 16 TaxID=2962043 RepID=UPI0020B7EC7A|nr:alpha/beta fold hydrolase [Allokutzneria sp. A3M-2-11 16]MCP3805082.1 alpha/beta fold hydrolase [Allokutzneria sp. A3M-2-11 16]